MPEGAPYCAEMESIIVIFAIDAPLSALSLRKLAKRAAIGIGRNGAPGGNNSGDTFLAFSTVDDGPMPQLGGPMSRCVELNAEHIDPVYLAAVEAVEEAVVNTLVAGEDAPTVKPPGKT